MHLSQRRKEGLFYFTVEQYRSGTPGAEVEISVFSSHEGEGILLLRRSLYFEEQSPEHVENFCKTFAHDAHYRTISLNGSAHWCRVARLYEINAGIINDEEQLPHQSLEKTCKELFHFLRRDLTVIENHTTYKQEMARVAQKTETALHEALRLLPGIKGIEIASSCQGASSLVVKNRKIFLPSCHARNAYVNFSSLPTSFLHYLQSGPLGRYHLARFEPTRICSIHVADNGTFIRQLTIAIRAYLHKQRDLHQRDSSGGRK